MKKQKSESKTLLMSVVMSSPGPLVVGLGLLSGRSATQIADFVRRSAELAGIIMAYVIYKLTSGKKGSDPERKIRLEKASNIFVGSMMCLAGIIMLLLALFSQDSDTGNVIPGLVIAVLGVVANTLFFFKYSKLNRSEPNAIIAVQARLYGAKSLVDICVSAALVSVVLLPDSPVSFYLDKTGSAVVALYLLWCGAKTVYERAFKKS